MDIVLVDYGAGNLTSVIKAFDALEAPVRVVTRAEALHQAHGIVIPGVGHFTATGSLGPEWHIAVRSAIDRDVPILGICLGLQWLFDGSEESQDAFGLGLIEGRCFRLAGEVKVPHVGWNTLEVEDRPSRLLDGLPATAYAYFTHSYAAPVGPDTVATTTHGMPFASAVEVGNTFGVQFHPEKSGSTGLRILSNFLQVVHGER